VILAADGTVADVIRGEHGEIAADVTESLQALAGARPTAALVRARHDARLQDYRQRLARAAAAGSAQRPPEQFDRLALTLESARDHSEQLQRVGLVGRDLQHIVKQRRRLLVLRDGRLAQVDAKLELIAGFDPPIPALLVMRKAAPVAAVEALRGKSLAVANPQSLVVLRGKNWLREQGLVVDVDYKTTWARNEDSLAQFLVSGEAPLAMMSMGEFRTIREEIRQTLDVHREFARVPNFFVLRGKEMPADRAAALRAAIARFPSTDLGREFLALANVQDIRPVPESDLAVLDGVVDETRNLLR
jgi:hypothetical protein